jgi:hypothetical protein
MMTTLLPSNSVATTAIALGAVIGVLSLAVASQSSAATITFTDITEASGTLGSTSFKDASITISATADTRNITPLSEGGDVGLAIRDSSATVTIASVGTFAFMSGTGFFVNHTSRSNPWVSNVEIPF